MTLGAAAAVLVLALVGIALACRYLRGNRAARILCIVRCGLIALAMAVYIGLTMVLLDAVRTQPPVG